MNEDLELAALEALSAELTTERAAHAETRRERDRFEAKKISLQDDVIPGLIYRAEAAEAQRDEALKALEPFANVAELIEVDTEGFSETDIFDLMFNDYLFERFTLAQFQAARRALGGRSDG